jgi:AP-2 complex subunit mu-1
VIAKKATTNPVVDIDGTSFLYIRCGDMYVVGVTKRNSNPSLIFNFLYKLVDLFKAYFTDVSSSCVVVVV